MKRVNEELFNEIRLKMVMRIFRLPQCLAERLVQRRQRQHEMMARHQPTKRKSHDLESKRYLSKDEFFTLA